MKEKSKVQKSCLNCYNFAWDGHSDAFCTEHLRFMSNPESNDNPNYGYCSDYVYKCHFCIYSCCPKNPENVEIK